MEDIGIDAVKSSTAEMTKAFWNVLSNATILSLSGEI